ncbi:MAG TPA: DUF6406 domain-containing protein [Streptosporangiaceae bacterium]
MANGVVERADGLSFGGSCLLRSTDDKPERVIVSMWDGQSDEREFELCVGDTLEFSGQTWRLDDITDHGQSWDAQLTRVA